MRELAGLDRECPVNRIGLSEGDERDTHCLVSTGNQFRLHGTSLNHRVSFTHTPVFRFPSDLHVQAACQLHRSRNDQ